jgi:hypothetical protein
MRLLRVVLSVAILFTATLLTSAQGIAWRTIADSERAIPGRALPPQFDPHLYAARGEYQAFQIVIPAGVEVTDAVCSDLTSGQSHKIPASNVTFYREHYVNIDAPSPDRHGGNRSLGAGSYPDPLIPFRDPKSGKPLSGNLRAVPFRAEGNTMLTLWIDVFVPRDAPAAEYRANVMLTSDKGKFGIPWTLTVWNFDLPLKPTLKSSFAFWNAPTRADTEELLRHRLMPQHIAASPSASLDRALEKDYGLTMTDAGYWSGADNSHCSMKPAPAVKDLMNTVAQHDPGIWLFNYTADEVGKCRNLYPQIAAWGSNLHEAHIKNLVVMGPVPGLFDSVDIWVVLPMQFENPADIAAARAHGNEIWSYNALVQDGYSPKWLIDYDTIGYRLQAGFLSESLGLTGLLYWRIDRWDNDPWTHINNEGVFSSGNYPGDGLLVYPGAPVGMPDAIVPSIRLQQLREGEQDFEYVELLKHLGRGDWALERIRTVAKDWNNWSKNGAAVEAVRRELGTEIDRLSPARK